MEIIDDEQEHIRKSHPIIIELITRLLSQLLLFRERIHELENRVHELENRINLNSTNSSIPPSRNPLYKRKIPNNRVSSGKKPGGQKGHQGTTLLPVDNPDITIQHKPTKCSGCGAPVQTHLTEFLELTYILRDLHGCSMSPGTVINMIERVRANLEDFTEKIRELLITSPVVNTDEMGVKVGKRKFWLHVASTNLLTLYGIFESRGHAGIKALGVLPQYFGIAVHDFWDSYFRYPCNHGYCNAHILRELKRVEEETKQNWAVRMRTHLIKAKKI